MNLLSQFREIMNISGIVSGSGRVVLTRMSHETGKLAYLASTSADWAEVGMEYCHPVVSKSSPISLLSKARYEQVFDGHPLRQLMPHITSLACYHISETEAERWALTIVNPSGAYFKSDTPQGIIERLVALLQSLIADHVNAGIERLPSVAEQQGFSEKTQQPNADDTALQFLTDTLLHKQRLLSRNTVAYVSLRTWSKPIKNHQIKALTAVKGGDTRKAAKLIGVEMIDAVQRIFGASFCSVVPVPFGSSGRSDCLSVAIGEEMAKTLSIPVENVLTTQGAKPGLSHPKKSARLAPFKLMKEISGRVLLVDDVASSGRHIELARQALEAVGCVVSTMVWISD
jgi:predicted amidophosphoribosyltransferase